MGDTREGCMEGQRRNFIEVVGHDPQTNAQLLDLGTKRTHPHALNHEPYPEPSGCKAALQLRKDPDEL